MIWGEGLCLAGNIRVFGPWGKSRLGHMSTDALPVTSNHGLSIIIPPLIPILQYKKHSCGVQSFKELDVNYFAEQRVGCTPDAT